VCPEVADETNPSKEASPTGRAEVSRGCAVSAGDSFLACCSLLLGLTEPAFLYYVGSFGYELAPGGSVRGKRLLGLSTDVEVF